MRDFESSGCSIVKEFTGPLEVNADSYRIEQVVVNLLINAMKYGAGSPIIVRAKKLPGKVLIEVEDKGPGIKSEDLERIFLRFERAVSGHEVSGLGLGLYISREIMELHHGSIHAKSDLGKGSTFIVEIPV
jgi:signal transduction histidine kinase